MSVTSHIEQLRIKHQNLSNKIETAQKAPATPAQELARLKREKLRLKDEIGRLTQ